MTLEEAIYKEEALAYSFGERYKRLGEPVGDLPELEAEHSQYAEWFKELKAYKDKDMRLIYANPLEEAIRCAMCTNPMRSDRGCDGGCEVDEWMLKKVIKAVNGLILEVESDERR